MPALAASSAGDSSLAGPPVMEMRRSCAPIVVVVAEPRGHSARDNGGSRRTTRGIPFNRSHARDRVGELRADPADQRELLDAADADLEPLLAQPDSDLVGDVSGVIFAPLTLCESSLSTHGGRTSNTLTWPSSSARSERASEWIAAFEAAYTAIRGAETSASAEDSNTTAPSSERRSSGSASLVIRTDPSS
jgi:hypothetical protein